ncbi:exonuclease DPD1, chloroplastic/mitochondrial-like isoform X2 [Denticeps clupeoides]|uniref:exodeoxyribonuclease III n=1 Tax=Denticeps clupeoides TaxID=299321 RepID=A0AAY4E4V8_9TELE|nr:exonuclease DPD1, chloroplastic/mitochondrial-like isoform X2 [Denticeps clupeoides]
MMDIDWDQTASVVRRNMAEPLVFFDLETTGLDRAACDIVQLAAACGPDCFNVYLLPRSGIAEKASKLTGFTVERGRLLLRGTQMETVPLQQALELFLQFLSKVPKPLLVAHNAKSFDAPILVRVLKEFSLKDKFQDIVSGFLDTYTLSKEVLANESERFSQEYLVQHFLNKTYDAHNALEDAKALQELFYKLDPSSNAIKRHSFIL